MGITVYENLFLAIIKDLSNLLHLLLSKMMLTLILQQVLNLSGWVLAATVCMAVVYGPYSANQGWHVVYLAESVVYTALSRGVWAAGIAFVIISCATGQGGKYKN